MELPGELAGFIDPILRMCNSQFPRPCRNCGKVYATFTQFLKTASPIGALQYAARPQDPFTLLSYLNCPCGSTMVLTCTDRQAHTRLARALDEAAKAGRREKKELLALLRAEVRRRGLLL